MSVQFGTWTVDGGPLDLRHLEKVKAILAPYTQGEDRAYIRNDVGILYLPFPTTTESRHETQPHIARSGDVFTWDGRLDNGPELLSDLPDALPKNRTDVDIVAAAYARWNTDCFSRLIGDWALAIWQSADRSLILAKDFIGTRHLYYTVQHGQITWSTILAPLVLPAKKTVWLSREYLAGCLSFLPAAHLTPYEGIHSVPPASFVSLRAGNCAVQRYWNFDANHSIRYRTDTEYEEHFRTVFRESVRRRLRSDSPVLGELSGGMDSSAIVCIADALIAENIAATPRLDTISYYSEAEPDWNERPYFTRVEQQRGRTGCHIDLGPQGFFRFEFNSEAFAATPGASCASDPGRRIAECTRSGGNRVILSGLGGDEVMGGVPTPLPELADLLARAQFPALAQRLKLWALDQGRPWHRLLWETSRGFLPRLCVPVGEYRRPAPWLCSAFVRRQQAALMGYPRRLRFFGHRPSFQENVSTLEALRRRLAWSSLSAPHRCEKRYPYLDRNLLEFLCAIPREQLLRPGQRRSLMRRALRGIVPAEVLARKRKAFVDRAPRMAVANEWNRLVQADQPMVCALLDVVDQPLLLDAMRRAREGREVPMIPLVRTLALECWLQHLTDRQLLPGVTAKQQETTALLS